MNYKFDVELKSLQVCGGKRVPDRKAVVRKDNGAVLGIVGNNYKIVPHEQVINTFDNLSYLKPRGVNVCREGAILFAQYDFDTKTVDKAEVEVGDVVSFGLRAFNSYNSQFGVGFELNAHRLKCKNGLVVPKTIARLSIRHFQGVTTQKFSELIMAKLPQVDSTIDTWRNWISIKPSEERIRTFFDESKMGKRLANELIEPAIANSQDIGVWGIFNTLTYHITHNLKVRGKEENRMLAVRTKERELLYQFYNFQWN